MSEPGRAVLLAISVVYVVCRFIYVALDTKNLLQALEIMALIFMGIFLINL